MDAMSLKIVRKTFYDTVDPRRRQEIKDARMIQEDHSAMANLPEEGYQRRFNPDFFKHDSMSAPAPRNVFDDEVF